MKRRSQRTYKKRNQRKNRKTRKQQRQWLRLPHKQRGGSTLNAPNGSVVNVRLEKGDDYQPFVTLYKEDAEREDL